MSGTVGIIAQDNNRYTMFSICLTQMGSEVPPNTRVDWGISTDIPGARNALVQRSLDVGSEWILFIDDDQVFPPNLLTQLLSHDVPIVSALYLRRAGGHDPVAFSHRREDGLYEPVDLTKLPGKGLLKIYACGAGGLLIRSEVFRAISDEPDWFQHGHVPGTNWNAAEDIIFCEKANRAGIEIFLDLEMPIGHMAPSAIWPSFVDEEWCLGFSVADGTRLYVPIEDSSASNAADSKEEVTVSHG